MRRKYLCATALGVLLIGLIAAVANKEAYQTSDEELLTEVPWYTDVTDAGTAPRCLQAPQSYPCE